MSRNGTGLEHVKAFEALPPSALQEIAGSLRRRLVTRGELLVRQGDKADALFIVVSGRFRVEIDGQDGAIAEIGAGSPIGEIAFFTGSVRTASVRATRDAVVMQLDWEGFTRLTAQVPSMWPSIASSLAQRLAQSSVTLKARDRTPPTSIALCQVGNSSIPSGFLEKFQRVLKALTPRAVVLHPHDVPADVMSQLNAGSEAGIAWFNDLESQYELLVYVCDPNTVAWNKKAVRQSDEFVLVASHDDGLAWNSPLNSTEIFAQNTHSANEMRLLLLHRLRDEIKGTQQWFKLRPVRIHHHLALSHEPDYWRLCRFLSGRAIGLVAGGGGALCAAHVGVYQALLEHDIPIDFMGGASGGAAMTAAFAMGASPSKVDAALEDIFVRRKALKRMNWPRYSILDHVAFDRALADHYTDLEIADLWTPFFALSTNLTTSRPFIHREGKLWQAVRATGSIPGLLPPCISASGELLVDGGVLDNVPVATMRDIKWGPNIVINLAIERARTSIFDYSRLPSRTQFLAYPVLKARKLLPDAPNPAAVLMRCLAARRPRFDLFMTTRDILLSPPIPPTMSMMDWTHHADLVRIGYEYAAPILTRLRAEAHPFFAQ